MKRKLNETLFTDIYIGEHYMEVKGLFGAGVLLAPAPDDILEDINELKDVCYSKHNESGRTEFSVRHDGVIYRVTLSKNTIGEINYVIRQTQNKIIPASEVGIPPFVLDLIVNPSTVGLVLVSGKMGVGKTTTAASVLSYRTSQAGSLSVAIEDPIETLLDGRHGDGRCIQLEIGEHEGYSSALKKAMRMGVSNLLIGEIRDADTAHEALKASINGMFVIATIHANSIIDAIERFDILCSEKNTNSKSIISRSLCAVMHQTMDYVERNGAVVDRNVNITAFHAQNENERQKIRTKISSGDFLGLNEIIKNLNQQRTNNTRGNY
ncbi:Flp pilus assembly complex ATPase component TadA [Salmonella enterica]|nr:hypothetical protein [Salmonella enterica subsp. enterica serovar Senftenberg]EIL1839719.1 Flp pilus assembly complex ATPase component TadA [Salmonella enterica]HBP7197351.1 Flp pilus assembly complex ATPase component TadA [Salmonella enterica subsp. enterica serovar Infantis]EIL7441867.1 Flp pilus assembly complex ATPase component TadA [Salmonella enterica]EIL8169258.1 Flp pilus assembly complex ATPase component TadA [Salmonella enterica]